MIDPKPVYQLPLGLPTIEIEFENHTITVAYDYEPPEPATGYDGYFHVYHESIGHISGITRAQRIKRKIREGEMEDVAFKAVMESIEADRGDR